MAGQCEAEWPSAVSGGMTDDRCPNTAAVTVPWGREASPMRLCTGCAIALEDGQ